MEVNCACSVCRVNLPIKSTVPTVAESQNDVQGLSAGLFVGLFLLATGYRSIPKIIS